MNGNHLIHVVAFALKPGIAREDSRAQAAAAITAMHPEAIPSIGTWICGWDTSNRPDSADFLLVSTFASAGDYDDFQTHPDHQRGKDAWKQIATWTVADVIQGGEQLP